MVSPRILVWLVWIRHLGLNLALQCSNRFDFFRNPFKAHPQSGKILSFSVSYHSFFSIVQLHSFFFDPFPMLLDVKYTNFLYIFGKI